MNPSKAKINVKLSKKQTNGVAKNPYGMTNLMASTQGS
jgi:hypothetical protein